MSPYFRDTDGDLYLGSCFDVLPHLRADSVDLVLTDPPYGVNWQSGQRPKQERFPVLSGDDGTLDVHAALALCLAALKRHRHLYVFGISDFGHLPVCSPVELIWDKIICGMGDLSLPWGPQHEKILFGVYQPSAQNRRDGDGRLSARIRRGSVLRSQRYNASGVKRHPTEKPVDILQMMIESSSLLSETCLDPFCGSGSTLVAARLEGRRWVGIEIDERYAEIAAKRLSARTLFQAMEEEDAYGAQAGKVAETA